MSSTTLTDTSFECYYSLEPEVQQKDTGVAVALSTRLWYFFRAFRSQTDQTLVVKRVTFDLSAVDSHAFQNSDAWSEPSEVLIPPLRSEENDEGDSIENAVGIFALPYRDSIYLFWYGADGIVHGTHSAGADDQWQPSFRLEGIQLATGVGPHALSGYIFEEKVILAWLSNQNNEGVNVMYNAYSQENIHLLTTGSGQIWYSDLDAAIRITGIGGDINSKSCISIGWTVLPCVIGNNGKPIGKTGNGKQGSAPVAFTALSTKDNSLYAAIDTKIIDHATGLPDLTLGGYDNPISIKNSGEFAMLSLDASNTMYVYSVHSSNVQRQPLMNSNGELDNTLVATNLTYSTSTGSSDFNLTSSAAPQVCFVGGSPYHSQLRNGATGSALETVATDLYRLIFIGSYSDFNPITCSVQYYGAKHVVATVNELYKKDEINPNAKQQMLTAKGIIDGPLPIPAENLDMLSQGGTVTEWDLYKPIGQVTYGVNDSIEKSHETTVYGSTGTRVSFEGSAGIDTEQDMEVSGGLGILDVGISSTGSKFTEMFGYAMDYEIKFSSGGIWDWGKELTTEANVIGLTRVLPDGLPGEDARPILSNQGYVSGSALSIVCITIAFEDPNVNPGVLPSRPSYVSMMPQNKVLLNAHYSADYAFTPGDLESYTVTSVNQRISDAYDSWKRDNPNAEDPFGDDYRLHDDKGYFEKVINKHALRIGSGGRNFLEFSISNDGLTETRVDMTKYNFQEWHTNVDEDHYNAGTWENLINVVGYELKSYLEAGATFGVGSGYSEGTKRSKNWGISTLIDNFPQATKSGHVCAYSFRLYFLPANNLWTQEVLQFSDYDAIPHNTTKPIDPNSCPWKIMFFVDQGSIVRMGNAQ